MNEDMIESYLAPLRLITHDSVRLESKSGLVVYIDPYDLATAPHDADVVLVTHDHYDHYSPDDIAKVAHDGTRVIGPLSLAEKASEELGPLGISEVRAVSVGEKIDLSPEVGVLAVWAYNIGKKFHPKENNWLGYVVTLDGVRYFHMGDTDQNPDNEHVDCDVLLVPVGGTYTMTAEEAVACTLSIRPQVVVPMHYGTVVGTPEDGQRFADALAAAQAGNDQPISAVILMGK